MSRLEGLVGSFLHRNLLSTRFMQESQEGGAWNDCSHRELAWATRCGQ